ncbi:unnamed protein product [Schistosoma curassoni]|uniref:Secreted protein n=1 Tax=Schistosoma curassoni TaxID=6186 RepID=A0A183JIP7_9TREM|nr:unnamed protein product [Schistosoma curassoni]
MLFAIIHFLYLCNQLKPMRLDRYRHRSGLRYRENGNFTSIPCHSTCIKTSLVNLVPDDDKLSHKSEITPEPLKGTRRFEGMLSLPFL